MYNFFKTVLNVANEKHKNALNGRSNTLKKLQAELLEVQQNLYKSYKNNELTNDEYRELTSGFNKISFINLSDQRKGKLTL